MQSWHLKSGGPFSAPPKPFRTTPISVWQQTDSKYIAPALAPQWAWWDRAVEVRTHRMPRGTSVQGRAQGQRLLPAPRLPGQQAGESSSPHYSGPSALTFHASAAAKLPASLCIELSEGITQPSWLKAQPRG